MKMAISQIWQQLVENNSSQNLSDDRDSIDIIYHKKLFLNNKLNLNSQMKPSKVSLISMLFA
jgi:hypothetical protein